MSTYNSETTPGDFTEGWFEIDSIFFSIVVTNLSSLRRVGGGGGTNL